MGESEWLRETLAGRRRDAAAVAFRALMAPAAWAYGAAVAARNRQYDSGSRQPEDPGVPVVSVGNLTAGGTGKTPVVEALAGLLAARGRRVAILSRGYRAAADGHNDEFRVLAANLPGVPHLQGRDRVANARRAVAEGADLLLLDDGFQHRRLARSVDLVLVDAVSPFGGGRLLPAGLLREPLGSLRRATAILLTRADAVEMEERRRLAGLLEGHSGGRRVLEVVFRPSGWIPLGGGPERSLAGFPQPVAAFCGLGNPGGFRAGLANLGLAVAGFRAFPDHHHYTAADRQALRDWAKRLGAASLVCTQKDLVKWPPEESAPLHALRIHAVPLAGGWEDVLPPALLTAAAAPRTP